MNILTFPKIKINSQLINNFKKKFRKHKHLITPAKPNIFPPQKNINTHHLTRKIFNIPQPHTPPPFHDLIPRKVYVSIYAVSIYVGFLWKHIPRMNRGSGALPRHYIYIFRWMCVGRFWRKAFRRFGPGRGRKSWGWILGSHPRGWRSLNLWILLWRMAIFVMGFR